MVTYPHGYAQLPHHPEGVPLLYNRIIIPKAFLTADDSLGYGGDIRIGDLTGDGHVDFLVYRAIDNFHDGGGMKPCFIGAFNAEGEALWQKGEGGLQPGRPGPVAIFDLDADGRAEVISFFHQEHVNAEETSFADVDLLLLDGATGEKKQQAHPPVFDSIQGKGANWAHQRILIANLRGRPMPQDFVVQLGPHLLAFDDQFNMLWSYKNQWHEYSKVPAYVPAVGDVDADGKDEVNGGYFLLDSDGSVLWEEMLGRNMDAVVIDYWDHPKKKRAFCSGYGHVMDEKGNAILKLGEETVPHGQELRVARFDSAVAGKQMMIRYDGHTPEVLLVGLEGKVIRRFKVNESPNNTGMEVVYWNGPDKVAHLYNGGILWSGKGEMRWKLPGLPPPAGDKRMGWYHCIPADVCGDKREEVVVYNPWDRVIYIYTPAPYVRPKFLGYHPTPRQYNVRLMD